MITNNIIILITGISILSLLIASFWVIRIDYMNNNHPDYKGEDFLDEDSELKQYKIFIRELKPNNL